MSLLSSHMFPDFADPAQIKQMREKIGAARSWQEQEADAFDFETFVKVAAHNAGQDQRVAEMRRDLVEILGHRLETEISGELSSFRLSEASQRVYARDNARFRRFCQVEGVSYLPATPEAVALFLLETCAGGDDDKPKPAMASRLCTSIRLRHQLAALPDPTQSVFVRAIRRWIKQTVSQPEPVKAENPPDQSH